MKTRLIAIAVLALLTGLLSAQSIFGAFQIVTEPQGAAVTLYGSNQYLGSTPQVTVPFCMDQTMTYNWGNPGRLFDLVISKEGYIPIRQQIFVPFSHKHQIDALRHPQVHHFNLVRQPMHSAPQWPHWNPGSYYYFLNPGYGPGNNPHHQPGDHPGPGGNHGGSGGNHRGQNGGGHGGGNNGEPGHKPPSGGHAGNPRP